MVAVQVFGTDARYLIDTGAVTNIISAELAVYLTLEHRPTQKTTKVVDRSSSRCIGDLRDVSVTFGDLTVKNASIGIMITLAAMERIGAVMDFEGQLVHFYYEEKLHKSDCKPISGYDLSRWNNLKASHSLRTRLITKVTAKTQERIPIAKNTTFP